MTISSPVVTKHVTRRFHDHRVGHTYLIFYIAPRFTASESVSAVKPPSALARLGFLPWRRMFLGSDIDPGAELRCTNGRSTHRCESPQLRGLRLSRWPVATDRGSPARRWFPAPLHTQCRQLGQKKSPLQLPLSTPMPMALRRIQYPDCLHTKCTTAHEMNLPLLHLPAASAHTARRQTQSISAARRRERNCNTAFV